jgi:hypothetical protein
LRPLSFGLCRWLRHLPAHLLRPPQPVPRPCSAVSVEQRRAAAAGRRWHGAARLRGPQRPHAHLPGARTARRGAQEQPAAVLLSPGTAEGHAAWDSGSMHRTPHAPAQPVIDRPARQPADSREAAWREAAWDRAASPPRSLMGPSRPCTKTAWAGKAAWAERAAAAPSGDRRDRIYGRMYMGIYGRREASGDRQGAVKHERNCCAGTGQVLCPSLC